MPAVARLRQGLRALTAWARPVDTALAEATLTPAEMALFRRLRRGEQLHSLNVLRTLRAAGETDPDLLTAALLHDVGKTVAPFTLPERVLVVLARAVAPGRCEAWGRAEPRGWKRPFAISRRHPEWSAEMMAAAGCSPRAVTLARRHQEYLTGHPRDDLERLLLALQEADAKH